MTIADLAASDPHIAMIIADASGNVRAWNRGAEEIFGHSAELALTRRVDLVVPPAYRDMHWAGFNRTMGTRWTGHESWGDIEGPHRSGTLVPLQVLLTPLRDAEGSVHGVFAMFRRPVPAGEP